MVCTYSQKRCVVCDWLILRKRSYQFQIPLIKFFQTFFRSFAMIEDITCPHVDTNFIFECSSRYLTRSRSLRALVRNRLEHEKIKLVFTSGHVIFCTFNSYFEQALVLLDDNVVKWIIVSYCIVYYIDIDEIPGQRFLDVIRHRSYAKF